MIGDYPRAVIWDDTARHHQTVLVDRKLQVIEIWCWECERGYELMLRDTSYLRRCLDGDDSVQVIAWVERDG